MINEVLLMFDISFATPAVFAFRTGMKVLRGYRRKQTKDTHVILTIFFLHS